MPHSNGFESPRVSVVLPTYRRQHVLARAIDSILRQTMSQWEVLVVDDEPNTETNRIVESYSDPRIRYLAHQRNRGLSAARNTGIRNARSEYIAFLDDDDMFFPRKLEVQCDVLDRRPDEVGVVSCFEEIRRRNGTTTLRAVHLDGDVRSLLLKNDLVRMQLLMVRRTCFERVGLFDERLPHHEDYDMTLRLSCCCRFETIPEPLVGINATPDSLSTDVENRIRALETIMATHPEFEERRRVRARWERRLARHHAEQGRRGAWRRHMARSILTFPLGFRSWVTLVAGLAFGPQGHIHLSRLRGKLARTIRGIMSPRAWFH